MQSIFNPEDSNNIIIRLNKLSRRSKAEWGRMNASQMLTHCRIPLHVATGDLRIRRRVIGILFGRIAKKKIFSDKPFGKNLPTDRAFIVKDDRDFEKERNKLQSMIRKLNSSGTAILTKDKHPFFGKLTEDEWGGFIYKHLDHHLRQFGV